MKTVDEWSHEFDLLYNNIASDKAPGLEPYEISKFLTAAQEAIVVGFYKGSFGAPFESTEEVSSYLSTLVKQAKGVKATSDTLPHIVEDSVIFNVPDDLLFRTWEGCKITNSCGKEVAVPVVPVTQDEYWRTVRNPFKKQNNQRVLRLEYSIEGGGDAELRETKYSELVSSGEISEYSVRYLAKPSPIILEDLPDGLSINGETTAMTCKLPEALHQTILSEAVRMAKATWSA